MVIDGKAAALVLPLFKPRILFGAGFLYEKESAPLLPQLKEVEFLALGEAKKEEKPNLAFLDSLPALRTLMLIGWDPLAVGPLPAGCERLKSLLLLGCKLEDLVPIAHLTGLEELYVNRCEKLADIGSVAALTELKALSLAGCEEVKDLSPLKKLAGLKTLSLPPGVAQEQFAAIIADHPGLESVELIRCEKVIDLSPLQGLKGLRDLVLLRVPANREPLLKMDGLRFLALDKKLFEESPDEVAKLDKALPDCLIVQAEPMCLGSGWILLLVPAAAGAWLARRRRRKQVMRDA